MKYFSNSSDNMISNTLFHEQVTQVKSIFDHWNECERTVVIYALIKKMSFYSLKLLMNSIENHLRQNQSPQQSLMYEEAANASSFLNKLLQRYNSLTNFKSSSDNIDANSDQEFNSSDNIKSLEDDLVLKYNNKDNIVNDLLTYLPLLRPNNDEGKKVYIQFLPLLIEDSIKHNLSIELVQQYLSLLLIHPVIKSEDRMTLQQHLLKLHDHLSVGYSTNSIGGSNYNIFSSENPSSFMSTTSSMSSVSSSSSQSSTTWPTTIPQIQTNNNNTEIFRITSKKSDQEFWDLGNFQVTPDFCDDLIETKYPTPIGNNSASQSSLNNGAKASKSSSSTLATLIYDANDSNDEHHLSFSKNGTDVEFDNDMIDTSKTNSLTVTVPTGTNSSSTTNDFLTVPNFFNDRLFNDVYGYGALSDGFSDDGNNTIKTRRSNSLTTPTASCDFTSSSAENLANLQKPRSFSLSMESSRNALMTCGSETRLDKLVQMQMNNNLHQVGMGNIAVWLKSLRLHKYLWLFTNMTYEQMMDMNEEYLENLGVTKGARHKLVLCIQKLSERSAQLKQIEKELLDGTKPLKVGLDEITNIILTPMKPINSVPCDEDVATNVMRLLDCAFQIMQSIKYLSSADEESVNVFLWVLDKALHHEAFLQQAARLKEYKYKLQRIKMMFANKLYNGNSTNNKGNNMKMRWTKTKLNQGIVDSQKNRKNSMTYYNNIQQYQPVPSPSNNKQSISYPTFANTSQASPNLNNFQRSASRDKLNQFTLMQQQHHIQFNQQPTIPQPNNNAYHRNSLNSLMPFPIQQQQQYRRNSCGVNSSMSSLVDSNEQGKSISPNIMSMTTSLTPKTTTMDINSRLESLCRQMTEQAIN
ncbi:protein Smaug [Chironomus tepperi]|uniref:protein Smaug n=1 Tax=Chironomus tepperi TaxID=113505 RepID=UPI00391F0A60